MLAVVSGAWTSTVSAANSMRAGPALAARADASAAEVRATIAGCGLGVAPARAVVDEGAAGIGAAIKAERAGFARCVGAAPAAVDGAVWVADAATGGAGGAAAAGGRAWSGGT